MIQTRLFKSVPGWTKPVVVVSLALLVSFGCKEQNSSSPPPSGGMPPPPSGGMPAPPSGGMPPPPSPSGGSSGDSGSPAPPMPSGGSQGDGSESGPTGSDSADESSGDIGSFPGDESSGPPPMPGTGGAGEGAEAGGEQTTSGGGESEESSDWEDENESDSTEECGDTGSLPGGVGGMGQDGECIGGGASASDSDSSSESSAGGSAGGGSSDGEESAVQGTGGAGEIAEFPTESSEERAERLGKELDKSIGGFDEVLMEEQGEISSVSRNTEGFGEGVEGDGGISLGEQSGNSTGGIAIANNGALPESPLGDMTDEQIRERTPEDIPVMVDDDIIARQLREAALSEEDPALRERLWEEYRKYSGN